jgi:tetratricopeptide (TPR) repeat protein
LETYDARRDTRPYRGDRVQCRVYADSAQIAYRAVLRGVPTDAQSHAYLGEALAYLGRHDEAIREAKHGLAMAPVTQNATFYPTIQFELARIYTLLGDRDAAIDQLEELLRIPYYLSRAWLRIDPTFTVLRGNPRFERLIAQPAAGARPTP